MLVNIEENLKVLRFKRKRKKKKLTQFFLGAVVKLIEFKVLATCHKEVFLWVEGGRVDGSWSLHCLDKVQAGQWTQSKRKLLLK